MSPSWRDERTFDLKVSLIPMSSLASYPDAVIVPWGWNPSLVRTLQASGVSECQLPSMEELEQLWGYTHRRHAVETLAALRSLDERLTGEPRYVTSVEELLAYLELVPGDKVLKMPLSGSGKGLIWILGGITDKQVDWCRRVIRGQGGVVVEPIWDRIRDFAMEFWLDNGTAKFAGYSLFKRPHQVPTWAMSYSPMHELRSCWVPTCPFPSSISLGRAYCSCCQTVFPVTGVRGRDMMVCATSEEYKAHPCVEINMRMNMGLYHTLL